MTNPLLYEFSNAEIEWMLSMGKPIELSAGILLIDSNNAPESLYWLLEGELAVSLTQNKTVVQSDLTDSSILEFDRLVLGNLVGVIPFLEDFTAHLMVRSLTPAKVLALPRSAVSEKLRSDSLFAAHFYRATVFLLMRQLTRLSQRLGCNVARLSQMQLREASMVFAELQDSDLDWLIAVGQVQQFSGDTVLIQAGRPIDEMHLILEGSAALNWIEYPSSSPAFLIESPDVQEQELARLSRGDLVGELLAIDGFPSNVTVRTLRETEVLSVPKWRLKAKLLHDPDFAARFYRVLALLLANKQQAVIQQLGYDTSGNELNSQRLSQLALAEARFEWMLKRIGTQLNSGEAIQW
ncbi:cyclic nucleotide-binding domain-containing protein [Leptolyngbya ohadii]|uniref:cyclic nucleotide-binding domain-containing protein n=1 Tax=Leptolyngbya ohadii TaxID=1962290 RepID=UPI000B599689|nr:cyclic nucleotide-binding domain-containing protein [Leptolyngbya ohadii]